MVEEVSFDGIRGEVRSVGARRRELGGENGERLSVGANLKRPAGKILKSKRGIARLEDGESDGVPGEPAFGFDLRFGEILLAACGTSQIQVAD